MKSNTHPAICGWIVYRVLKTVLETLVQIKILDDYVLVHVSPRVIDMAVKKSQTQTFYYIPVRI